jgi:glutathione S-transferase
MNSILYGMPGSLYTGKVRSYLRKQRIPFEERIAGDPRFVNEVIPVVGRWIVPVLQTPQGQILQDGALIIDHLETLPQIGPRAAPDDPVLRVVAHIFEMFGGEGMMRPAMHFRWNFDETNLAFIQKDFLSALAPGKQGAEADMAFAFASGRMRKATLAFGVNAQTAPTIERTYQDFLERFDKHLETMPYLLGASPGYGDYALVAPLFAHLARDPYPAQLMKRLAPRVWRWVERMNAPDADAGEYMDHAPDWIDLAQPCESLDALLRFVAEDYLPEVEAMVRFTNDWLAERPNLAAGTNGMPRPGDRHIGMMKFEWRGIPIEVMVMPYRILMLQRIQDSAALLNAQQGTALSALLKRTGLQRLLELRCHRRVEREGHLEVWGPPHNNERIST